RFPRSNTTGLVPSIDAASLDGAGGGGGAGRAGRRTNPPPTPAAGQGTQVAHFTGEGPAATRVTVVTDAPEALPQLLPVRPERAAAPADASRRTQPQPQPRRTPQPFAQPQ